jgi:hypothetical protein
MPGADPTNASSIMGVFPPTMLPVLSGLARGHAVCDFWFGSVPAETLPSRALVNAGTSQGHRDDNTTKYTCPTIYSALSIPPGTVFRAPDGATPLDHTSILKTIEARWSFLVLTARDAAAVDIGNVLTLAIAHTDDPLRGVNVPVASSANIESLGALG